MGHRSQFRRCVSRGGGQLWEREGDPSRSPPYSFAIEHWKYLGDVELLDPHRGLRGFELLAGSTADPLPLPFSPSVSLKVPAYASQKKKK